MGQINRMEITDFACFSDITLDSGERVRVSIVVYPTLSVCIQRLEWSSPQEIVCSIPLTVASGLEPFNPKAPVLPMRETLELFTNAVVACPSIELMQEFLHRINEKDWQWPKGIPGPHSV